MKIVLVFLSVVFSAKAFSEGTEVRCFNHSDSDYELVIQLNANNIANKASLKNVDWGAAGNGVLQDLATQGEDGDGIFSHFYVITSHQPSLGLEMGQRLDLTIEKTGKVIGATLSPATNSSAVGVQFDSYTCKP